MDSEYSKSIKKMAINRKIDNYTEKELNQMLISMNKAKISKPMLFEQDEQGHWVHVKTKYKLKESILTPTEMIFYKKLLTI